MPDSRVLTVHMYDTDTRQWVEGPRCPIGSSWVTGADEVTVHAVMVQGVVHVFVQYHLTYGKNIRTHHIYSLRSGWESGTPSRVGWDFRALRHGQFVLLMDCKPTEGHRNHLEVDVLDTISLEWARMLCRSPIEAAPRWDRTIVQRQDGAMLQALKDLPSNSMAARDLGPRLGQIDYMGRLASHHHVSDRHAAGRATIAAFDLDDRLRYPNPDMHWALQVESLGD
ncbi:hypothetical protein KIPB_008056 [Kipferlia bialata]|uniref:Uncharacterized protein n=1 Tax=Kipferlia bialata TaxID=797122 RepID=A0A391NXB8_9EUKA|nr:hypothetical protein KIPB_008056 [Kipferlia bialata]|eukprot:g8056.t1